MLRHFYDSFIDTQNMIRRFCTISLIVFTLTLGGCAQVIAIEVATIAVKATAEILGEVMDAVASPSPEKAKVSGSTTSLAEAQALIEAAAAAKALAAKTSSDCSVQNINVCSDALVCTRGSRLFNLASSAKYSIEAKKRNLTCGVVSTSSTTTTSSDSDICTSATQGVESQKRWRGMSSAFYEYVVEAKNRGLTCGVGSSSSTTQISSACSLNDLNACSNGLICARGSRLVDGKRIWDERSKYIKYYVEAKKRGLSCGVKAISSVTKVSSVCSIKNTKACNDNDVCQFSTITNAGKKAWYKSDHSFYQYVTEAKKRNLTCGVEVSSSTTKTSPACSTTSVNTCTDYLLCRLSTITDAGKRVWVKNDHSSYPYVIEAKKRNLSCGINPSS